MKTRSVGIVGVGHVGAHCAYSLAVQGIVDELVLVDVKEQKVISECQGLRDSVSYLPHRVEVRGGTYGNSEGLRHRCHQCGHHHGRGPIAVWQN